MTEPASSGRIEYPDQGFAVVWDERGLTIEVLDYHAGPLHLSWETIRDLARRARPEAFGGAAGQDPGSHSPA